MKTIFGIIKTSLIDYPGKISMVVFFSGCNLKCSYCHNQDMTPVYTMDEVFEIIKDKYQKKYIDAVVITGGEAVLHGYDLIDFLVKIKKLGILIKLDTNAEDMTVTVLALAKKLLDYVAVDLKNVPEMTYSWGNYGVKYSGVAYILNGFDVDWEFRTTAYRGIFSKELWALAIEIGLLAPHYYIQNYQKVSGCNYESYNKDEILGVIKGNEDKIGLRGFD